MVFSVRSRQTFPNPYALFAILEFCNCIESGKNRRSWWLNVIKTFLPDIGQADINKKCRSLI